MPDSPNNPRKKGGKGAANGKEYGRAFGTEQEQPSNEAKKAGWARKKLLKDLLNISTGATLPGSKNDYRKLTADYLGIDEKDVTIKMVMDFRQVEKAILKGDTQAYVAVSDRAFGKPAQQHTIKGEITNPDTSLSKLPFELRKQILDHLRAENTTDPDK